MKILVTGAGGLLGGRIIDFLLRECHKLIAVSRSYRGSLHWNDGVQIVNADINQTTDLYQYLDDVSVVIHAAGINASDSIANPSNALFFNGYVTAKLLQASIDCNVKQFYYISTTHVYSNILQGVINEKSPVTNLHPYASSHKAGEDAVLFAHLENKIQGTVLRLSNTFGYPINIKANCWMLLVNDLCRQAAEKGSLQLYSNGKQFRNFVSITEVCKAIAYLINLSEKNNNISLINIASKNTISVLNMAKIIQRRAESIFGYKIPLFYPESSMIQACEPFILQTTSLDQHKYSISDDLTSEIDALLMYCKKVFNT